METYSVEFTYTYTGTMQVEAKSADLANAKADKVLSSGGPTRYDISDEEYILVSVEKSK